MSHVSKAYGGVQALRDVSLEVDAGERVALIGPNGAGKTTCFNVLNGQLAPDAGEVRLDGVSLAGLAPHEIARRGVGRTFQVAALFASMTVRENLQMALLARRGLQRSLLGSAARCCRAEAEALLERVALAEDAARPCAALAYGALKRLELALALAQAPRVLLMDEPTAGLAAAERAELMALASGLARSENIAVLFTEHDMDVVFGFASRVLVLHLGELIAGGAPEAVRADARVREVYLGDA
ncbi:MAG TPA: ABC transporter ATP-binding protein [Burkholderiales bacterium]|nr:ABC transporter ATP-binding protein [Burkholderiales bacterium]